MNTYLNLRLVTFLLLFGSSFLLKAQAPTFTIKVKFTVQKGGLDNSLITITKNGGTYRVIDPSKGKYPVELELGAEYVMTFTKPGYITKAVMVDTHVPKGRENEEFAKFLAEVELEMQPPDQVITYSQPVGRIKYSNQSSDFDFDNDYTKTAVEAQKKDKENAKPMPKDPVPNPSPPKPVPPAATVETSKPVPVAVKQPEYKPEPEKPKPAVTQPDVPQRTIVKNKVERTVQEDRRKLTTVVMTIDGVDYTYRKEEYNWGGVYFYKDGRNITEGTFLKETEE